MLKDDKMLRAAIPVRLNISTTNHLFRVIQLDVPEM